MITRNNEVAPQTKKISMATSVFNRCSHFFFIEKFVKVWGSFQGPLVSIAGGKLNYFDTRKKERKKMRSMRPSFSPLHELENEPHVNRVLVTG